jgi:hypothetical protein
MINKSFFYNNTPSNVIVIVAFNVSYRLLLEAADTVRCYRPLIQSDVYRPLIQTDVTGL